MRAVDVFVDALDLAHLGFERALPAETGRPAYHPATLLKIYIYGYLNRVQSSRRLEREAQRNVELVWLTGRLMPDFKTIADFRKDNGEAIRTACREFVLLCRGLGLFEEATVAIDGSKFKAVNNRDKNFTERKLQARMQQLDESVARYLTELDRADRDPSLVTEARVEHLKDKLARVKEQMGTLRQIAQQLNESPDQQVSLTDPDARSMATSGRGTGIVGYNVQTAVDTKHHLIVAHEVTNVGHDRTNGAWRRRRKKPSARTITALADRGYFKGEEILRCADNGIVPLVPKPQTSNNKAAGLYDKSDFVYDEADDTYRCPAGERAIRRMTVVENGQTLHKYWSSACRQCPNFEQVARHARSTLGRWLDRAEQACFVVTTREVLGLPGEDVLALPPLQSADGVALFVQRAEAATSDFHPGTEDKSAIAPLVDLLDGLPLAIELAAARVRVMPPRLLLQRMSERFKLLVSKGGRPDRQSTLRAAFDWSWDLLPPHERAALAQLSVFEGGFTLEAAEAVIDLTGFDDAPWSVDAIHALVDKSFVRPRGDDRFDLLVSVQVYAAEHLQTEGRYAGSGPQAMTAAQMRAIAWFAALGRIRAIQGRCADLDNLVTACRRAMAFGDSDSAAGALDGAWDALSLRGPFETGVELAESVCAMRGLNDRAAAHAQSVLAHALVVCGRSGPCTRGFRQGTGVRPRQRRSAL